MFHQKFAFGTGKAAAHTPGVTVVHAADLYSPETGSGFVTEKNRREQAGLQIPELNANFYTPYWYRAEDLTTLQEDENGCFLASDVLIEALETKNGGRMPGEHRRLPFTFKLNVPHPGNYFVTVTVKGTAVPEEILLYTGRRQLAFRGRLAAGQVWRRRFVLNTCGYIPRGKTEVYADNTLDITMIAALARFTEIEVGEAACPTLYIAGDSTLTDQSAEYPYAPGTCYCGWGQMLGAYLGDKTALSNHAHSGLTSRTFRDGGHFANLMNNLHAGDYFVMQFGHNDINVENLQPQTGYRDNLTAFAGQVLAAGAYPMIVTPVAQNTWGGAGEYADMLFEYAAVCREVGDALGIPVLDLHRVSMAFVKKVGRERAAHYFYPKDNTHSNDYGAYSMAGLVAGELRRVCPAFSAYRPLAESVTGGYGAWRAADTIVFAEKPGRCLAADAGGAVDRLAEFDRPDEPATRADVIAMVNQCANIVPCNVYNNEYADVQGDAWYAGAVESAFRSGMIPRQFLYEGQALHPAQQATMQDFLVLAMGALKTVKPLPPERICVYDGVCDFYARLHVRAARSMGLIPASGDENLRAGVTRGRAVALCRKIDF